MDEGTLTALKASIKHWEENVAAETPDEIRVGAISCPLCTKFWVRKDGYVECNGCPVLALTGEHACGGSPYDAAELAYEEWGDVFGTSYERNEEAKWQQAAQAQLDFLKSLLPEQVGAQ